MKEEQTLATLRHGFSRKRKRFIMVMIEVGDDFVDAELLATTLRRDGFKPERLKRLDKLRVTYRRTTQGKYIITKVDSLIPGPNL